MNLPDEIDLTKPHPPVSIYGTFGQGLTGVRIGGVEATHFRIDGNVVTQGVPCLSCGAQSDWFGNLPCGH